MSPDSQTGAPQGFDLVRQRPLEVGACVMANPDHPQYTADKIVTRIFPGGKSVMFGVMDGVGSGDQASANASEIAQRNLSKQESPVAPALTIAHAKLLLKDAIFKSNREIVTLQDKLKNHDVDTTVSVGIVCQSVSGEGRFLVTANAGDSRIYRYRPKDGSVSQLTKDNSLTQNKVDAGILTPEQAFSDPERNFILKSVGDRNRIKAPKDIDTLVYEVNNGDYFIAVSDGVTDNIPPQGFALAVREELQRSFDQNQNKPDLKKYAKGIAQRASNIMNQGTAPHAKKDDISVTILRT